ncbi:hypothetical protein ACLKA6_015314 [Drosophila palustris]
MPCAICGNSSELMCQRCAEPYCGDVCQQKDWQRHKYFCITMPRLVSLKPLKPGASICHDVTSMSLEAATGFAMELESMTGDLSINGTKVQLSTEWRECVNPKPNEFFDCRVTHVEKDGAIWIVEEVNIDRLKRLDDNMARCMQKKQPCTHLEEIAIGDLVCVAFEKEMCRAEVIQLNANSKCAEVHLIDNGAVATIDVQNVYLAVPRMAEIKRYAFRVIISPKTGTEIHKLTNVTLRLVGGKTVDGIQRAQLKTNMAIPLDLPVQMLSSNPEVIVLKTFAHNIALKEPQVALVQIKDWGNLNDELNQKTLMNFIEPFPKTLRVFFLSARTESGYRRAFLIDLIEEASKFLVYEMDEGRISITDEVRRIPLELLDHPPRVFAISLTDNMAGNNKISSLQQTLTKYGRDLIIQFEDRYIYNKKEKLHSAQATLLAAKHEEQVCTVRADKFLGRITELNLKYWQEPIENGSLVYITHVVSYHTICISSVQTKQYADLFKSLDSKCFPFDSTSEIPTGSIVLVVCPIQGYYRAEVLDMEGGSYRVRNIDTGIDSVDRVPSSNLRKSCAFLENLPVSQLRASIKAVNLIPSDAVPPNTAALQLLMELYEHKSELLVEFVDSECSALDLLDANVEPSSLAARMLPMIFTASLVKSNPVEIVKAPQLDDFSIVGLPSLPPSPSDSDSDSYMENANIERHYFDDIKRDLIPLGKNVQVLILLATDLHKTGYVMGCFFANQKAAEKFQYLLNHVNDFAKDEDKSPPDYLPKVGEMCLTLFTVDNSWYRGVCLKVINNRQVEIFYCDYGNSEVVPLEMIRPISADLLFTVHTTKCFIDGFNNSKDFMILEQYLAKNNNIVCTVLEGPEPNTRLLKIPTLDKILSTELK